MPERTHHWVDGTTMASQVDDTGGKAEIEVSHNYVWDTVGLTWVRMTQPGSGSGGGGAVTVADGADVAQGSTADTSAANTVVGVLKAIKAAVQGTLTVATHAVTQSGTWTVQPGNTANTTAWKVDGSAVTQPVSGTFFQATQPVSIAAAVDVSDRAARLVGRARLTDDTNLSTVKAASTLAAATDTALVVAQRDAVDVSDRAARLLGVVDKGKVWDGTNIAAVKAASALAAATDPALVVQLSPQSAQASTLAVTVTAAVNTAATLTLPAPAAGLFHYITSLQIVKLYSVVGVAAGTGVIITSTNLPGSPAWTTEQLASAAGTAVTVVNLTPATPIKSSVAATATTVVAPVQLQTIWRINATYYTAP